MHILILLLILFSSTMLLSWFTTEKKRRGIYTRNGIIKIFIFRMMAYSSEMVWKMNVSLTSEMQCSLIKNKENVWAVCHCHFESRAQTMRGLYSQLSPKLVQNFHLFVSYLNLTPPQSYMKKIEGGNKKLIFFHRVRECRKHKFRINDDDDKNLEAEPIFYSFHPLSG